MAFTKVCAAHRTLHIAEDQPAHCGVHVESLACASDDPGKPVVEAEGGQSSGRLLASHGGGLRPRRR